MTTRPRGESADEVSRSIQERSICGTLEPENLKKTGSEGVSQMQLRRSPVGRTSIHDIGNDSPRRNFCMITTCRCVSSRSSNSMTLPA